jgi:hypothetical protein
VLPALADEASCDTPCCLHGGTQTEHVNIGNGAVASSPPYVHSAHQHLPTLVLIPSSHSPSLLKWHTQKQPIRAHRDLQIRGGGGGAPPAHSKCTTQQETLQGAQATATQRSCHTLARKSTANGQGNTGHKDPNTRPPGSQADPSPEQTADTANDSHYTIAQLLDNSKSASNCASNTLQCA